MLVPLIYVLHVYLSSIRYCLILVALQAGRYLSIPFLNNIIFDIAQEIRSKVDTHFIEHIDTGEYSEIVKFLKDFENIISGISRTVSQKFERVKNYNILE